MLTLFLMAAAVAVAATFLVITRTNAVHALLYLVVSLLAVSLVFFLLGAPFAAALEVIIYAGAIMVLFVFVVMMLNLGSEPEREQQRLLEPGLWKGPVVLAALLLGELIYVLVAGKPSDAGPAGTISPTSVGASLFGPYVIAVEIASFLLLAGLVAAFHLGRQEGGQP